jgi:hypothetical protein
VDKTTGCLLLQPPPLPAQGAQPCPPVLQATAKKRLGTPAAGNRAQPAPPAPPLAAAPRRQPKLRPPKQEPPPPPAPAPKAEPELVAPGTPTEAGDLKLSPVSPATPEEAEAEKVPAGPMEVEPTGAASSGAPSTAADEILALLCEFALSHADPLVYLITEPGDKMVTADRLEEALNRRGQQQALVHELNNHIDLAKTATATTGVTEHVKELCAKVLINFDKAAQQVRLLLPAHEALRSLSNVFPLAAPVGRGPTTTPRHRHSLEARNPTWEPGEAS